MEDNTPTFSSLTELKDKNQDSEALTAELEALMLEHGTGKRKNRRQRRHATDGKLTGHSKHSRFIWIKGVTLRGEPKPATLTKVSMTKVRPWDKKDQNRKDNRIAKASRRKNR